TASWTSSKTPPATPPRSAAPKADPSSTAIRSSGSASTEATIRSQRSLRAPPPETRATSGSAPVRDVEEQRPRCVGYVGRKLAREAKAHVVLGQEYVRDPLEDLGLMP